MMAKANSHTDASNTHPSHDFFVLTFRLAGQAYGIPIADAFQIIDMVTITKLPQAPPAIQGIINVRGEIVPVMDLRLRFGLEFEPYQLYTPIILTNFNGQKLGLVVDSVETIMEVPQIDLEATESIIPPELAEALGVFTPNGHLAGVSKAESSVILILDVETLLSNEELERLMKILLSREPEGVPA